MKNLYERERERVNGAPKRQTCNFFNNSFNKRLFISLTAITAGILIAIITMAFTGPGSLTPGSGDPVFWRVSGSNVYYSGGNVGIGTTTPTAKLTIGGTVGTDGIKFPDGTTQTTAGSGGLVSIQTFTISSTWTKSSGVKKILVKLVGGGGGGGGQLEAGGTGSGGGAGGYSEELIDVTSISSVTVTVGAAGTGGAPGGSGGTGGTTSFGSYLSATGGSGGQYGGPGGSGGSGSGGDINIIGGDGAYSYASIGGASYFGGGGGPNTTGGRPGKAYGSGGGSDRGYGNYAGAAGAAGIVIVYEYN